MVQIDELLPPDPLQSEVVLHVRLHLRRAIRSGGEQAPQALAMLFGFTRADGTTPEWKMAAAAPAPLLAGAQLAARKRGASEVVALGHDAHHMAECKEWLLKRKQQDDAFAKILATDTSTLLELSKARDLAVAQGQDEQGQLRPLPILIQGDTGTGKELLAKGIHLLWARQNPGLTTPFQVVHVAGMTDDLINDELFGHVPGAYTGADKERVGRIEAAHGGTLLIDEVGDLPPAAQLRLLRFLQSQRMSRVGENKERPIKVRIIAATWRKLDELVSAGQFRMDLFHRLRFGSGLTLPPLSKRENFFKEVVPQVLQSRGHRAKPLLTRSARDALALYSWPGNLRELVGVLEEALSLAGEDTLRVEHLPAHLQRAYLSLPLYERASGFLSDEVEGQQLTEDHVRWRVAQIARALETVQRPEPKPELKRVAAFLSDLDEQTSEHQELIQVVEDFIKQDQDQRWQTFLKQVWAVLATQDVPQLVVSGLRRAEAAAQARADDLLKQQREREPFVETMLGQSPWIRLFLELQGLPLFQHLKGESDTDAAGFIVGILRLVRTFFPSAVDRIREEAKKGDFLKRLQEGNLRPDGAVERGERKSMPEPEASKRRPEDLSRQEWETLAKSHRTQAEASKATGYDPKTIVKYLTSHGIPNPWAKKDSNG
ncbi:sigma-54-dependent Fis family transcriptional regulator [Myxococcus xanthus]|uniref:sigma-54-dependent Fis family transcriptional regulator n=1 Tax=Myxococcus xanthus TaxID=34 RepID=UPI001916F19E|nr:sigma 54-interacting transcriptional regulator [Myxococcus xanthus]QQR46138.1 sigma-54-dependent Fis family transcriptional regulator [Myxococcus xanthus]